LSAAKTSRSAALLSVMTEGGGETQPGDQGQCDDENEGQRQSAWQQAH